VTVQSVGVTLCDNNVVLGLCHQVTVAIVPVEGKQSFHVEHDAARKFVEVAHFDPLFSLFLPFRFPHFGHLLPALTKAQSQPKHQKLWPLGVLAFSRFLGW
jgi:hypothetical protein